jgi:lipoyl(octanoyl) transferase
LIKNIPEVKYSWIHGLNYKDVWDLQSGIHKKLIEEKRNPQQNRQREHHIFLCEHGHVYTLGKSGSEDHLLVTEEERTNDQIEYFKINRGGDITYHGPGQITGYPILDLDDFYHDVHRYVREIEEVIIRVIHEYGLLGKRLPNYTGVWLEPDTKYNYYRKICAIGVHMSRWVSLHGFALNVNTDLKYFGQIIPCGITDLDKRVTSISKEINREIDIQEVCYYICTHFEKVFNCKIIR